MKPEEVKKILETLRQASDPGKVEDGRRINLRYDRIPGAKISARAKAEAERAKELGLPPNSYTGRVSRIWESSSGDMILNMYVELERENSYRSFNVEKGLITSITLLEE